MALLYTRLSCIYRGSLISREASALTVRLITCSAACNNNNNSRPNCSFVTFPSSSSPQQLCNYNFPRASSRQLLMPSSPGNLLVLLRYKSRKKRGDRKHERKQYESDDEDEDKDDSDDEELESGKDFRDIRAMLSSLRMDVVLKAGLNLSRNKVEVAFYESRIRVNGKKILKKSSHVYEGDEVDVALDEPSSNPKLMYVARVEVRRTGQYNPEQGKLVAILRRYPKLLVERPQNFTKGQSDE